MEKKFYTPEDILKNDDLYKIINGKKHKRGTVSAFLLNYLIYKYYRDSNNDKYNEYLKKLKSQVHTVYYALNNLFIVDEELYEIMTTEISEKKYIDIPINNGISPEYIRCDECNVKTNSCNTSRVDQNIRKATFAAFIENYKLIMDNKFNNWKYLYKLIDDIVILGYFNWFTVKDDNLRKLVEERKKKYTGINSIEQLFNDFIKIEKKKYII